MYSCPTMKCNSLKSFGFLSAPPKPENVVSLMKGIYGPFSAHQRGYGDVAKRAMLSQLANEIHLVCISIFVLLLTVM